MKNKEWGSVDQKFLFVRAVVIRNREQRDARLIEAPALVFMAKGPFGWALNPKIEAAIRLVSK